MEHKVTHMATGEDKSAPSAASAVGRVVIHHGSLYQYTAGCLCGVLVKESTMRKLVKLQAEHVEKVKRLLCDEADKGNVFPSMWTLHYPNGEQTYVEYIDTSTDVQRRIESSLKMPPPKHMPLVFVAGSMDEAKRMADEHAWDCLENR